MPELNEKQQQALRQAFDKMKNSEGILKNNAKILAFAAQRKTIDKELEKRDPLVKEYINIFREMETKKDSRIGRMVNEMKNIAAQQEMYKMAAGFCKNDADKQVLLDEVKNLDNHPAMIAYGKYVKGLEYFAGMEEKLDQEVVDFYARKIGVMINDEKELKNWRAIEVTLPKTEHDKLNQQFRKLMAPAKAREIFMKQSIETFNEICEQFIGKQARSLTMKGIFNGRMSVAAFCVGQMLLEGHPLEKILDENELQDVKKIIGDDYMQHREAQDNEWYANEMYKGAEAMIGALKDYAIKHKETIKTDKDLVFHADKLGMLSMLCYDTQQELKRVKAFGSKEFKSRQEFDAMEEKVGAFYFCAGTGTHLQLPYKMNCVVADETLLEMNRQVYIKTFLDELKKDEPDLDSILTTADQFIAVDQQFGTFEEFLTVFSPEDKDEPNSTDRKIDFDEMDSKKIKMLASMFSVDFYEKNDIKMHNTKIPVTLIGKPAFNIDIKYKAGNKTDRVITRGGKQLIETDMPYLYFNDLEKKGLRGNAKDNSDEFNNLVNSHDETIKKLNSSASTNKDCLNELKKLKEAAEEYIRAKRAQKGYASKTVPEATIDAQMLGKEKGGASIFTSRGKDRYEFALNLIERATTLENKLNEFEKQNPSVEKEKVETEIQNKQNDAVVKNEATDSKNLDVIEEVLEENELDGF